MTQNPAVHPAAQTSTKALILLGLIALVIVVYLPVAWFGYVDWDDGDYASNNHWVQQGLSIESVRWAFTTTKAMNWHPLTWLSLMLDVNLFGDHAWGHHVMNMSLHAVNVVLLAILLWTSTGALWRGAIAAALLVVHPVHVESVAWVSERKDVLSLLFWLLTMCAYVRYVRQPSVIRYLVVALCLALALLAKQMVVTLPAVLLLLDGWPLQRVQWPGPEVSWRATLRCLGVLALEKLPLLALCAAAATGLGYSSASFAGQKSESM